MSTETLFNIIPYFWLAVSIILGWIMWLLDMAVQHPRAPKIKPRKAPIWTRFRRWIRRCMKK